MSTGEDSALVTDHASLSILTLFSRGELAKAVAALLGHGPQAPAPLAVNGASGPRTDVALRERRATVIRV